MTGRGRASQHDDCTLYRPVPRARIDQSPCGWHALSGGGRESFSVNPLTVRIVAGRKDSRPLGPVIHRTLDTTRPRFENWSRRFSIPIDGANQSPRRMATTSAASRPAVQVARRLRREYPDAQCSLVHESPLELLVATILSAQCTDERVNMVTKELFRKYPDGGRLRRRAAGRAGAGHPEHRLLPQQGQEHQGLLPGAGRGARRRGAAGARRSWSSCPASGARRPTSCWAPPLASPRAWSSTRTWRGSAGGWG